MAVGAISCLLVTCTISEATVDLLALFHKAELLGNELRYTVFDVMEDEMYLSTSLLVTRFSVCVQHTYSVVVSHTALELNHHQC